MARPGAVTRRRWSAGRCRGLWSAPTAWPRRAGTAARTAPRGVMPAAGFTAIGCLHADGTSGMARGVSAAHPDEFGRHCVFAPCHRIVPGSASGQLADLYHRCWRITPLADRSRTPGWRVAYRIRRAARLPAPGYGSGLGPFRRCRLFKDPDRTWHDRACAKRALSRRSAEGTVAALAAYAKPRHPVAPMLAASDAIASLLDARRVSAPPGTNRAMRRRWSSDVLELPHHLAGEIALRPTPLQVPQVAPRAWQDGRAERPTGMATCRCSPPDRDMNPLHYYARSPPLRPLAGYRTWRVTSACLNALGREEPASAWPGIPQVEWRL